MTSEVQILTSPPHGFKFRVFKRLECMTKTCKNSFVGRLISMIKNIYIYMRELESKAYRE